MVCLIVAFFIISPLTILYTTGYRYDWQRQEIQQTGVLSVDTDIERVHVSLNGVVLEKKLPLRLPNLTPGTYHLRIWKEGYKAWDKDITIESKQTTYIKDITLLRDAHPIPIFSPELSRAPLVNIFPSFTGAYAIFHYHGDNVHDLALFDTATRNETTITRLHTSSTPTISWSPYASVGTVVTHNGPTTSISLIDPKNNDHAPSYLFNTSVTASDIRWKKGGFFPSMVTTKNDTIVELYRGTERVLGSLPAPTPWLIDANNSLWYYQFADHTVRSLSDRQVLITIPNEDSVKKIIEVTRSFVMTETAAGIAIFVRDGSAIQDIYRLPATHVRYHQETKQWYIWSPSELWNISEQGRPNLLTRTSEKIRSITPLNNKGLILIATDTTLFAFHPGYFVSHTLLQNAHIEEIVVNQEQRRIFFFGTVDDRQTIYQLDY